jgi:hypothetical protein
VVALDAEAVLRFTAQFPLSLVVAEAIEHELDHVALAVMRRRRMGENE